MYEELVRALLKENPVAINLYMTAMLETEKMKKLLKNAEAERDAAVKDVADLLGNIEQIRVETELVEKDDAMADLCKRYCRNAQAGFLCYDPDKNCKCRNFRWTERRKEGEKT